VPEFEPDELLFRRVKPEHVHGHEVDGPAVEFPDFSVNRSRFSEPKDALLFGKPGMGVCQFEVQDVPRGPHVPFGSPRKYSFKVVHVPEDDNYSHSEIQTHKDGAHPPRGKVHPLAKKWFRDQLRQKMHVVIKPE